jgi:hypothetical protein
MVEATPCALDLRRIWRTGEDHTYVVACSSVGADGSEAALKAVEQAAVATTRLGAVGDLRWASCDVLITQTS